METPNCDTKPISSGRSPQHFRIRGPAHAAPQTSFTSPLVGKSSVSDCSSSTGSASVVASVGWNSVALQIKRHPPPASPLRPARSQKQHLCHLRRELTNLHVGTDPEPPMSKAAATSSLLVGCSVSLQTGAPLPSDAVAASFQRTEPQMRLRIHHRSTSLAVVPTVDHTTYRVRSGCHGAYDRPCSLRVNTSLLLSQKRAASPFFSEWRESTLHGSPLASFVSFGPIGAADATRQHRTAVLHKVGHTFRTS